VIGRLRGVIADRSSDGSCIVDVSGVGYEIFVPIGTLGRLPSPPEVVTLHVHTHVREDAFVLYGFANAEDRAAFRALLGVSNVGPKLASAIMGSMSASELAGAIASQDHQRFKGIPGVGKKTAERILLDLRDKLDFAYAALPHIRELPRASTPKLEGPLAQVAALLVQLGFKPQEAERAVAAIEDRADGRPTEALLKDALAQLG
jgi:holliday junction DNA helicase RuvA